MIRFIQLFGERRSGTNFVSALLRDNMQNVEMTYDFGWKHWFIKDHYPRGRQNQSTDYECIRPLSDNENTLFLCVFRNPYDWVRSINAKPHHAPDHWQLPLTQFLREPWHSFEKTRLNPRWPVRSDHHYFIEQAENILRLRTQKIVHLFNLERVVENVRYINYETLRDDSQELKRIADQFQIKLKHPTIRDVTKYFGNSSVEKFVAPKYQVISKKDLEFIRIELDWDIEGRLGYHVSDYSD